MEVDVDCVQSDQEITEDILLDLGDVGQKSRDEVFSGWELAVSWILANARARKLT